MSTVAVFVSGSLRQYDCISKTILDVISNKSVDFFIATSRHNDVVKHFNPTKAYKNRKRKIPITKNAIEEYFETCKGVYFHDEHPYDEFSNLFAKLSKLHGVPTSHYSNKLHQFYLLYKCNEMRMEYERKRGFRYDIVIQIRPDAVVLFDVDNYIDKIKSPLDMIGNKDGFIVCGTDAITIFANCLFDISPNKIIRGGEGIHLEMLYLAIKRGVNVIQTSIIIHYMWQTRFLYDRVGSFNKERILKIRRLMAQKYSYAIQPCLDLIIVTDNTSPTGDHCHGKFVDTILEFNKHEQIFEDPNVLEPFNTFKI